MRASSNGTWASAICAVTLALIPLTTSHHARKVAATTPPTSRPRTDPATVASARGDVIAAKRCNTCALNWPPTSAYRQCYGCNAGRLDYISNATAMGEQDARRLKRIYEFETWLLTPEGKAAAEAATALNDKREADLAALEASLYHDGELAS